MRLFFAITLTFFSYFGFALTSEETEFTPYKYPFQDITEKLVSEFMSALYRSDYKLMVDLYEKIEKEDAGKAKELSGHVSNAYIQTGQEEKGNQLAAAYSTYMMNQMMKESPEFAAMISSANNLPSTSENDAAVRNATQQGENTSITSIEQRLGVVDSSQRDMQLGI
ncbi:MAG: hypothetical protein HRT61_12885, partial [Ekhidna sp.]|nr:hypothetical protein [Ekhidna sp.]